MKRITSTVTYTVPNWNFCNIDRFDMGQMSKKTCDFCIKTKEGLRCALYDETLSVRGEFVNKTQRCCKATVGVTSTVAPDPGPTIDPKDIMKQTIELYTKTVNDLINQGYPKPMADMAAKKYILGD